MQTKTNTLLAISIAAILTLSVAAIGEIPQVAANKYDKDDHDKKDHDKKNGFNKDFKEFSKKPDFESKNCIVTSYATNNLSPEALASLDCSMQAWLDHKGESLVYKITISGMELIDSDDNIHDDLYQLHIHKNTSGTPEAPKGPHQLNVYRGPGFNDADLIVLPVQGELNGIWDDGDENLSYGEPDNSHKLSEDLQLLCDGQIFSAGHGEVEDTPGHHAPYIKMLLEPTKSGEKVCKKLGF
jgi:hypothetical protein